MAKLPELDDLNELYTALENADKAGDVEGARELTKYILQQEDLAKDPERLPISERASPELAAATGAATGAGLKTLQMIPQGISKAGQLFGQAAAKQMLGGFPNSGNAIENWAKTQYKNIPFQGGVDYKHEHQLTQPLRNTVVTQQQLKPLNALFPTLPPTVPTTATMPPPKPSMAKSMMGAPMRGLEKVGSTVAPYASAVGKFLNPIAALGGAGYAGADMYNRHQVGDTTGAILSGIGMLGKYIGDNNKNLEPFDKLKNNLKNKKLPNDIQGNEINNIQQNIYYSNIKDNMNEKIQNKQKEIKICE
jgi:hypothetical protein